MARIKAALDARFENMVDTLDEMDITNGLQYAVVELGGMIGR